MCSCTDFDYFPNAAILGEILATHTNDCQIFTALVDKENEEIESFEVSLTLKQ